MTHKAILLAFGWIIGILTFASTSPSAWAGLEFTDSPAVTRGKKRGSSSKSGNRVQVFGKRSAGNSAAEETVSSTPPAPAPRAGADSNTIADATPEEPAANPDPVDDYVERLKEDRKEFEEIRRQNRARQMAAGEKTTATDATVQTSEDAAPAKTQTRAKRPPPAPAPKKAPPAAKAAPAMETETITPQGSAPGTSNQVGKPVGERDTIPEGPEDTNPAFPYTHLLPSPFNVPQGTLVLGTSVTYGVFDFFQVSTNLMRTLNEHWNFQAKVPLIEYPTFMTTAFVDYENYNPRNISALNPDVRYARWQPGLTTAYELSHNMAFFLGGNFSFAKDPIPVVRKSGYLKGARIETDWSWRYNPPSSRLSDNALAAGVTYDLTYEQLGFGLTHYWRSFQLGLHYTLSDTNRFLPIVGFQAAATF